MFMALKYYDDNIGASVTISMSGNSPLSAPCILGNPSKRGGMDGVFQGLAGLLRGISRGQSPREIPRNTDLLNVQNFTPTGF